MKSIHINFPHIKIEESKNMGKFSNPICGLLSLEGRVIDGPITPKLTDRQISLFITPSLHPPNTQKTLQKTFPYVKFVLRKKSFT